MVLPPQAVRFMLPAIISQCVVVLKDTSLGCRGLTRSCSAGKTIATYVGSSLMTYLLVAADLHRDQLDPVGARLLARAALATRGRGAPRAVAEVEGVLEAG